MKVSMNNILNTTLNNGIEKVSYRSKQEVQRTQGDFPLVKTSLPLNAAIPSHTNAIFSLNQSSQLIENTLKPEVDNRYVMVPANYSRLFQQVKEFADTYQAKNPQEEGTVQDAKDLFAQMDDNFLTFTLARNALIQG